MEQVVPIDGERSVVAGQPQGRPATMNALLLHWGHLLWILCPGLIVIIELTFWRV